MITSIEFHFRPSQRARRSEGSLYVRVIHHRSSRSLTLPLRLYPEEWDTVERQVVYNPANSHRFPVLSRIESELLKVRSLLEQQAYKLHELGCSFTSSDILGAYRRRQGGGSLRQFTLKLCREMVRLGRERTARGYETAIRRLTAFTDQSDMPLRNITSLLIRRFEYCLREEGKSLNTISFYMRSLRAIYNKAIKEGLLEPSAVSPFEEVYTGIQVTRKRALTKEEMMILQNWKPLSVESGRSAVDSERDEKRETRIGLPQRSSALSACRHAVEGLLQAQQLFLFCFHARGMSFVDMAYLRKEDIRDGVLRYKRKKTGQLLEIKVSREISSIIDFFKKETAASPYVFPIIRRPGENERLQYESALRTYNNRLKRLAKQLTVDRGKLTVESEIDLSQSGYTEGNNSQRSTVNCLLLSSHVARHTWATIAKQQQIPLIVISEGLGHTSEKTTAIYLASFDREVLDMAAEKVSRAIKTTG